jgi:hypothetical protein
MINSTRGLKTGDLVHVGHRTAVVESVSLDDLQFTGTYGTSRDVARAELVPLAGVPALGPSRVPAGPSRAWADLIALPTGTLRAMAASGMLPAAEQWGADDELGERDDPFETPEETAARLYLGIDPGRRPLRRY